MKFGELLMKMVLMFFVRGWDWLCWLKRRLEVMMGCYEMILYMVLVDNGSTYLIRPTSRQECIYTSSKKFKKCEQCTLLNRSHWFERDLTDSREISQFNFKYYSRVLLIVLILFREKIFPRRERELIFMVLIWKIESFISTQNTK